MPKLNDEQLAAIFDMKDDGYLRITKQALESLRETFADLKRQVAERDAVLLRLKDYYVEEGESYPQTIREMRSIAGAAVLPGMPILDAYVQEKVEQKVLELLGGSRYLARGQYSEEEYEFIVDKIVADRVSMQNIAANRRAVASPPKEKT